VTEICPDKGHGRKNEHFPLAGNIRSTKSIFRGYGGKRRVISRAMGRGKLSDS